MNEEHDKIEFIANVLKFNNEIMELNIKYAEEIESLQQEIKELNDSVIWWTNRYNALQRDYEKLKEKK